MIFSSMGAAYGTAKVLIPPPETRDASELDNN